MYSMETRGTRVEEPREYAANKTRDISSKNVFKDAVLYAQFLRDNVDIPALKNVQPEDIEDVSEQYRPYLGIEFASDTVKKIRLRDKSGELLDTPLYLISLTEHKSVVDYNVAMQLLKYMVCIWQEYAKECEREKQGCSRNKNFRYPPILPIVYYEGRAQWTADRHLRDRVMLSDIYEGSIPDFTYEVIRLHDYDNEELLNRGDEMSLIMLFNKIQNALDLEEFLKLSPEQLSEIIKNTPEYMVEIIACVMKGLCVKIGATEEETEQCIRKVKERKMGYLFENMEKMNIQEERRKTAEAQAQVKEMEEKVIQVLIETCQEFDVTKEQTIQKVKQKFQVSETEAAEMVKIYWK